MLVMQYNGLFEPFTVKIELHAGAQKLQTIITLVSQVQKATTLHIMITKGMVLDSLKLQLVYYY